MADASAASVAPVPVVHRTMLRMCKAVEYSATFVSISQTGCFVHQVNKNTWSVIYCSSLCSDINSAFHSLRSQWNKVLKYQSTSQMLGLTIITQPLFKIAGLAPEQKPMVTMVETNKTYGFKAAFHVNVCSTYLHVSCLYLHTSSLIYTPFHIFTHQLIYLHSAFTTCQFFLSL